MGRLTDDTIRLVEEVRAARGERGRLLRDLWLATTDLRRSVVSLRKTFVDDLAGARAAWRKPAAIPHESRAGSGRKTKGQRPPR